MPQGSRWKMWVSKNGWYNQLDTTCHFLCILIECDQMKDLNSMRCKLFIHMHIHIHISIYDFWTCCCCYTERKLAIHQSPCAELINEAAPKGNKIYNRYT